MATFFGEVVEARSRAFWDSDDEFQEDDEEGPDFRMSFVDEKEPSFDNELFILVHSPLCVGFAKTCLLDNAVLTAEVTLHQTGVASSKPKKWEYEDELIPPRKPHKPSKIYTLKGSVVVCVCSPDLKKEESYWFTECIKQWLIKSQNVITLTFEFRSTFLPDEDEEDLPYAILRELHTDLYKGVSHAKVLEAQNMIFGVPAGTMTYCQLFKIPAIMYVVYTDSCVADSITAQPLVDVFSKLEIKLMKDATPTFKKRLYFGVEVESNLYT